MATAPPRFWPTGTVYGTLLSFQAERRALGERMTQPPYQAAPTAPVLYVKTANTWSASASTIAVPAHVAAVEVGASIAMVLGPALATGQVAPRRPTIAGYVLVNDLSVPHASFFRPPVRFKCLDGFFGIGPCCVPSAAAGDPAQFVLEVRVNGELRQIVRFAELVRNANQLLADVSDFMTLREGDLLLLGCDGGRPLARVGDQIDIDAPSCRALGTLSNALVAESVGAT